jgi:CspA family cold shock protein
VKWYDAGKGYGFIIPDEGGADVLIHANCIRAAGMSSLDEGAKVSILAVRGERGLQALELVEVTASVSAPSDQPRPTDIALAKTPEGELLPARVKWFNKQKGFGFLNVFGRNEDIFVHMETLRRFGFQDLEAGEAVCVRLVSGPRGDMAGELRRWDEAAE